MPEPEYWHSRMSILLRYEFMENELLRQHELAYMTAFGSALGNPSLKTDKVLRQITSMSEFAKSRIPYMRPSDAEEGAGRHDDLVEDYRRMREALTVGRSEDGDES